MGRDSNGAPLAGSSKNTYNAQGWFENDAFSARLIYSYRSAFLTGIVSALPQYVDGAGDVSASLNVKLTPQLSLSFDAKNLTGALARQYVVHARHAGRDLQQRQAVLPRPEVLAVTRARVTRAPDPPEESLDHPTPSPAHRSRSMRSAASRSS